MAVFAHWSEIAKDFRQLVCISQPPFLTGEMQLPMKGVFSWRKLEAVCSSGAGDLWGQHELYTSG